MVPNLFKLLCFCPLMLFCSYLRIYHYQQNAPINFCYKYHKVPATKNTPSSTMEALQYSAKDKKLSYVTVPIPKIEKDDDVIIKVAYSGICGTDLHIIQGEFPCNQAVPFSLGHEFSGTVVEVGSKVKAFKKGDRVSVDPNSGCNVCRFCHSGNPHYCKEGGINNTIGIYRNGGWAQYVSAPDYQIHRLPDKISFQQAALCEPISCLTHGYDRVAPIPVGSKILVTGAGIIGNLWVAALHHLGHRNVTVSEPNKNRLKLLDNLETGFELITPDVLKERQKSDPNYLFDFVIECSGFAPATEHAFSLLNYGGTLCVFGVSPPHAKITIEPFQIYWKEAKIVGVNINPFSFPKSIGLIEAFGERYIQYDKLGIKTFALKDYQAAIDSLKTGTISKAVFQL